MSDTPQLSEAQQAALAKAQEAGVTLVNKDGSQSQLAGTGGAPASTPAPAQVPPKPDFVPDKFYDPKTGVVNYEAMAKSYTELERTRSQAPAQTPPAQTPPPAETPPGTTPTMGDGKTPEQRAAEQAATQSTEQARQAAINAANAEMSKDGKLSDTTYQALEKAGYNRSFVDAYIEGQQAKATLAMNTMYETAGGKASFDKMLAWGKTAYTPAEADAFDAALRSGNSGQMTQAVKGLSARFEAEFGKGASTRVEGGTNNGGAPSAAAFKSAAEITEAMKDAKYATSAEYRQQVAARIAASRQQGIDLGLAIM